MQNSFNITLETIPKCVGISDDIDVEKKVLKISLDNPYFNKPIKMIQNLKDVNICKESIYNFYYNLKSEKIFNCPSVLENENEKPLISFLSDFTSNFNGYLNKSKIKSQITENGNTQNELFEQTGQDESHKGIIESIESLNSYLNDEKHTTQEDVETKSETEKKDIVQKINEFLKFPKFSSITEVEIMENDELKNFLELHSNNECFKEAINPILKKNYWQINFPLWADKVESFSSEQIIASLLEIIMTLIYQYYKIAIFKVIKTEEQKRIKEINNKYLSLNKYSAIPDLFDIIRKNAFSPPKKLLCDQFEEFLQSHNIKRDETIDTREKCEAFIKDTLNEFETKDIIEFGEKMKQFFEKLTYIYIFDIKENKYKHIVYYYLREHIMKYIPFNGLTNQINYIVNEQDKMNEKYNIYKEKMLKETKDFIELN